MRVRDAYFYSTIMKSKQRFWLFGPAGTRWLVLQRYEQNCIIREDKTERLAGNQQPLRI
jgi:hypothetical protein